MGSYLQKYVATGLSLGILAYGVFGLAHKGIWVPGRWGGGVLLRGPAGWVLFSGMALLLINQLYSLFAIPPSVSEADIPKGVKIMRLLPFVCIIGSIFFPGISRMENFPY